MDKPISKKPGQGMNGPDGKGGGTTHRPAPKPKPMGGQGSSGGKK